MPKSITHVVDPRNRLSIAFSRMLPMAIASQIHCLSIGKVIKYNHSDHTCNVQPLAKQSNGDKRPVYNYCIVPASIYKQDEFNTAVYQSAKEDIHFPDVPKWKPLQYGSIVAVGACDREIDNLNLATKRSYQIGTSRMHSFNDGIVLGVIKP